MSARDVVIVAAYHDRTDHIEYFTANWEQRFGLRPHAYAFGTNDGPETYDEHWNDFENFIGGMGDIAIIGTSFGVTIGDRAIIEHPDKVKKMVAIAGPHRFSDLNPETIDSKYPMLRQSLSAYDADDLPVEKIMTLRPFKDSVINPNVVKLEGAANARIPMSGHALGIVTALAFQSRKIARFIKENE